MESPEELSSYELKVKKNIEANREVLRNLGLGLEAVSDFKDINKKINPRKPQRLVTPKQEKLQQIEPQQRVTRIVTRRSSKLLNFTDCDEDFNDLSYVNNEENSPIKKVIRIQVFGNIEGVKVGDWWLTRLECSTAGIHRPTVAGIHGKQDEGCYSLALSGGYEDDVDCGNCFTYTGCGGRNLKGTKAKPKNLRTAPQSKDQVLDGVNAALASNIESKKPVRVIRGYKLNSPYAPEEGYRYDGLYSVEKYWIATGLSGFKVFKYALKRLPNQDPAPWETYPLVFSPKKNEVNNTPEKNTVKFEERLNFTENKATPISSLSRVTADKEISEKSIMPIREIANQVPKSEEITYGKLLPVQTNKSSQNNSTAPIRNSKTSPTMIVKPSPKIMPEIDVVGHLDYNDKICKNNCEQVESIMHSDRNSFDKSENNLTPISKRRHSYLKDFNDSSESEIINQSTPLSERKVRFSPKITYCNEINDSVRIPDYYRAEYHYSDDSFNSPGDAIAGGKKQMSILNYFSPVKKPVEIQPTKSLVNPKSLRGNRFSSFSMISLNNYAPLEDLQSKKSGLKNSETINGILKNDSNFKSPAKRSLTTSSQKRKYSVGNNRRKSDLDLEMTLSKKRPSMMENLIKQSNEKLKLYNQIKAKDRKLKSPTKQCAVMVHRLEQSFFGWDEGDLFLGFEDGENKPAEEKKVKFNKCLETNKTLRSSSNQNEENNSENFCGWDLKKNIRGSSGLVQIGFMINKLSES